MLPGTRGLLYTHSIAVPCQLGRRRKALRLRPLSDHETVCCSQRSSSQSISGDRMACISARAFVHDFVALQSRGHRQVRLALCRGGSACVESLVSLSARGTVHSRAPPPLTPRSRRGPSRQPRSVRKRLFTARSLFLRLGTRSAVPLARGSARGQSATLAPPGGCAAATHRRAPRPRRLADPRHARRRGRPRVRPAPSDRA